MVADDLIEELRERLADEPDVLVAYLYGSHARGRARARSDVDVAVLLGADGDAFTRRLELIGVVEEIAGMDRADVVLLNEAPPALAYRVVRDGRVILSRDEAARVDHKVRTVSSYFDMEPMRRTLHEGLSHRLREGRFGRS